MAILHPIPSRGVWRSLYRLTDPEEFVLAVAGATLRADFLAPHAAVANIERYVGCDWAIDFYDAGVKARISGPLLPGWVALCLILPGGASSWYGLPVEEGLLLCNPPNVPIDGCILPGFAGISVSVPVAVWEECRRVAGREETALQGFRILRLPPALYQNLVQRFLAAQRHLRPSAAPDFPWEFPCRQAEELAKNLATVAWEYASEEFVRSLSVRNRFRLARRAETWMRDHLAESFGIPEVSLALGVSRRELEYAFHTAFGESPRAFLESLRMNAVRSALHHSRGRQSVTEIALAHGFNHLGRFSVRYNHFFGQSPSITLKGGRLG